MLTSYFQNGDVGMTKESYFELCEMMQSEPLESEIPIELSDFPALIQEVFQIYFMLTDSWDTMGGSYLGKNLSNVFEFFNLYEFEQAEQILALSTIQQMDSARRTLISAKLKANKPSSSPA